MKARKRKEREERVLCPLRTAPNQTKYCSRRGTRRDCGEGRRGGVGGVIVAAFQEEASPWYIGGTLRIICSVKVRVRKKNKNKMASSE